MFSNPSHISHPFYLMYIFFPFNYIANNFISIQLDTKHCRESSLSLVIPTNFFFNQKRVASKVLVYQKYIITKSKEQNKGKQRTKQRRGPSQTSLMSNKPKVRHP